MRSSWVFLLAGLGACTLRGNLDHLTGASCTEPQQCPGSDTLCQARTCGEGLCSVTFLVDEPILSQKKGDCVVRVCDGTGDHVEATDEADVKDDGNDCTDDVCQSGSPENLGKSGDCTLAEGGQGQCDAVAKKCVECLGTDACTFDCEGDCRCFEGNCLPLSCGNGFPDADETDTDCGGICNPCDDGLHCETLVDCKSLVCDACESGPGLCCQVPTCDDGQKNGGETAPDCGGPCPSACAAGQSCGDDDDCESGVCDVAKCQAPTCTDGVQNGLESDEDCGGSPAADDSDARCPRCLPFQKCVVDSDCLGDMCRNQVCSPNCQDGIQNNGEQGIDCGIEGCPPCPIVGGAKPVK